MRGSDGSLSRTYHRHSHGRFFSAYMGSDWSQANLLSVIILIWLLFMLSRLCSKKLLSKSWRSNTFRIWLPLETLQVHEGIKRVKGGTAHTQLSGCSIYCPDEMMNLMMAQENVYASEASKMLVGFTKVATCQLRLKLFIAQGRLLTALVVTCPGSGRAWDGAVGEV